MVREELESEQLKIPQRSHIYEKTNLRAYSLDRWQGNEAAAHHCIKVNADLA